MHTYIYTYTHIHLYTCTHIHIYTSTLIHMYTYPHIHIYTCSSYMCDYIFIYIHSTRTQCAAHTHNGQSYPHHAWFESFQLWPGGWQLENDPTVYPYYDGPLNMWLYLCKIMVSGGCFFFLGKGLDRIRFLDPMTSIWNLSPFNPSGFLRQDMHRTEGHFANCEQCQRATSSVTCWTFHCAEV